MPGSNILAVFITCVCLSVQTPVSANTYLKNVTNNVIIANCSINEIKKCINEGIDRGETKYMDFSSCTRLLKKIILEKDESMYLKIKSCLRDP